MKEKFYSPKELAAELNVSSMWVMRRIRKGTISAERIGWTWHIPEDEYKRVVRNELSTVS